MLETERKLGPEDVGMLLSAEEFANADFVESYVYERVRGRLAVMSPAGPEHRRASRPFRRELGAYWGMHPDTIDDADREGWVATSPDNDRMPDICVYLAGDSSGQTVPHRVPDLVFEFVSGSRADQERDYIHKRIEYHAIGVKEYVIVDRFLRRALVMSCEPNDYHERTLDASGTYQTPLLPGLSVELTEVFAE